MKNKKIKNPLEINYDQQMILVLVTKCGGQCYHSSLERLYYCLRPNKDRKHFHNDINFLLDNQFLAIPEGYEEKDEASKIYKVQNFKEILSEEQFSKWENFVKEQYEILREYIPEKPIL